MLTKVWNLNIKKWAIIVRISVKNPKLTSQQAFLLEKENMLEGINIRE
jgi:hypothetical protein